MMKWKVMNERLEIMMQRKQKRYNCIQNHQRIKQDQELYEKGKLLKNKERLGMKEGVFILD